MFFQDRIVSILPTDKVLEIGPGATPYYRSDVFLEKNFASENDLIAQSGLVGLLKTDKPVFTYDGDVFPFKDKEFDYVVCSHVLEHVDDVDKFLSEVQRVGKKGYLEFPTIYYDYLYNFTVHTQFLLYSDNVIHWMPKAESNLAAFLPVQEFFYKSASANYHKMTDDFSRYFFQGFEWKDSIISKRVHTLQQVVYDINKVDFSYLKPKGISSLSFKQKIKNRLINLINKL